MQTTNSAKVGVLTLPETITPPALANHAKVYTKSDGKLYFQDGAGNECEIRTCASYYAEAYKYADANKTIIDTVDIFHALQDLVEGLNNGWTWVAGTRGTDITTMATYDGGASTLITTTADHNLNAGDYVTITGTTNYNSPYKVLSVPTTKTFEINKAWDGNADNTGTYSRGDTYICNTYSGGIYTFDWGMSLEPDIPNKTFTGALMINDSVCTKCRARDYFSKSEYETIPGGSLFSVSDGDHITVVIKNITDAVDVTIRHSNFRIHRL